MYRDYYYWEIYLYQSINHIQIYSRILPISNSKLFEQQGDTLFSNCEFRILWRKFSNSWEQNHAAEYKQVRAIFFFSYLNLKNFSFICRLIFYSVARRIFITIRATRNNDARNGGKKRVSLPTYEQEREYRLQL